MYRDSEGKGFSYCCREIEVEGVSGDEGSGSSGGGVEPNRNIESNLFALQGEDALPPLLEGENYGLRLD
jgi:hypothetical protein